MHPPQLIARPLVKAGLRSTFKLGSLSPLPLSVLRATMELGAKLFMPRQDVSIDHVKLGTVSAARIRPKQPTHRVMLHLHGGAFFAGSSQTHLAMATELAARCHATVYMLDYRRAPEHPYPAALDDGLAAYHALLGQGASPEQIVLGGDSGGCAHILSLAIALRDQGLPLPAALIMMSPFVDLTLTLASVSANAKRDPMLTAHALKRGADAYRGKIALDDPRISPLFAALHDLPPMLIQVGREEILLDDAVQLAERITAAGGHAECHIYQGMWHNFQMFNHLIVEAEDALEQIASFIRQSR
ncbi:MAG: alpha/beta hydrolase [Pseudomonadota bacterium]|nr:alpha/beta hydrolase [Pseudomonadota bacterium]